MFNTKQRSSCHKCKKREATWAWYLNFQWWNLARHHKSSIVEVRAIDANKIQQLWHIWWHSFKINCFFPFPIRRHLLKFAFYKKNCTKKNFGERFHISSLEGGGGNLNLALHCNGCIWAIAPQFVCHKRPHFVRTLCPRNWGQNQVIMPWPNSEACCFT